MRSGTKKLIAIIAALVIMLGAGITTWLLVRVPRSEQLRIALWADYYNPELIDAFQAYWRQQPGVSSRFRVRTTWYSSNEELHSFIATGRRDFCLALPSEYMMERLAREGLLRPLNMNHERFADFTTGGAFDNTVLSNVATDIITNMHATHVYGVPYAYGTHGIIYDSTMIIDGQPLGNFVRRYGWNIIWANSPDVDLTPSIPASYRGNIRTSMKNSGRDAFTTAMKAVQRTPLLEALGYTVVDHATVGPAATADMNTHRAIMAAFHNAEGFNTAQIAQAEALLRQLPRDTRFEVSQNFFDITQGRDEISLGLEWSSWGWHAMTTNRNYNFYIPREGTSLWLDSWVIPNNGNRPNIDAAHAFIAFMTSYDAIMGTETRDGNIWWSGTTPHIAASQSFYDMFAAWPEYFDAESFASDEFTIRVNGNSHAAQLRANWQESFMRATFPTRHSDIVDRSAVMSFFGMPTENAIDAMLQSVRAHLS